MYWMERLPTTSGFRDEDECTIDLVLRVLALSGREIPLCRDVNAAPQPPCGESVAEFV